MNVEKCENMLSLKKKEKEYHVFEIQIQINFLSCHFWSI